MAKAKDTRRLLFSCTCGERFPANVSGNGQLQAHVRKNLAGSCERQGIIDADTGELLGRTIAEVKKKGIKPAESAESEGESQSGDEERDEFFADDLGEAKRDKMRPQMSNNKLARGFVAMRHVPINIELYFLFQHVREIGIPGRYEDTADGLGAFLYDMVHLGAFANRQDLKLTVALARGFYELLKSDNKLGDGLVLLANDFTQLMDENANRMQYPTAVVSPGFPPRPAPEPEAEEDLLAPANQRLDRMVQNMSRLAQALQNFKQALQLNKGVRV